MRYCALLSFLVILLVNAPRRRELQKATLTT